MAENIDKKKKSKKQQKARSTKGSTKCTLSEDIFAHKLALGWTQRKAYLKAYPGRTHWKLDSIDATASTTFGKPRVRACYEKYVEKLKEMNAKKELWSREESVKTLRYVAEKNADEIERINEAYEEEIELLLNRMLVEPENLQRLLHNVIQLRKARRLSTVNNKGITDSVSELNKMHGFNEENINLNGMVQFTGETELED